MINSKRTDSILAIFKRPVYFKYLDNLRASGVTNMFGAAVYLQDEFDELNGILAREVLQEWMTSYNDS